MTILEADITDLPALQEAAAAVSKLTGGKLDYLINNAGLSTDDRSLVDLTVLYVFLRVA